MLIFFVKRFSRRSKGDGLHLEKYFLNLVESALIWIVLNLFRLIWHWAEIRLVVNQSEKGNYNPNLVWFDKIQKKFEEHIRKGLCAGERISDSWRIKRNLYDCNGFSTYGFYFSSKIKEKLLVYSYYF